MTADEQRLTTKTGEIMRFKYDAMGCNAMSSDAMRVTMRCDSMRYGFVNWLLSMSSCSFFSRLEGGGKGMWVQLRKVRVTFDD